MCCDVVLRYVMSCRGVQSYPVLCRFVMCCFKLHDVKYCVVLCCVVLCCVVLCCVVLCCVALHCIVSFLALMLNQVPLPVALHFLPLWSKMYPLRQEHLKLPFML